MPWSGREIWEKVSITYIFLGIFDGLLDPSHEWLEYAELVSFRRQEGVLLAIEEL